MRISICEVPGSVPGLELELRSWCYNCEETRAAEDHAHNLRNGPVSRMVVPVDGERALGLVLSEGVIRGSTHRGKGIVQVVDGPGDDDNVVDVQPEGQHSSSKAHT